MAKCRYRIREISKGRFICEERGVIWGWNGMFLGLWSEAPHQFNTLRDAERALQGVIKLRAFVPRVVKEYGCDKEIT